MEHRQAHLADYQNERLAQTYRESINKVTEVVGQKQLDENLIRAVAENYAKLLAYKDEYEIARLYTNGDFHQQLEQQFEGDYDLNFNLAPVFFPGKMPNGRPKKRVFGAWMMRCFRFLAKLKSLRGTPLDLFGYHPDRRAERPINKRL